MNGAAVQPELHHVSQLCRVHEAGLAAGNEGRMREINREDWGSLSPL